MTTIRRMLTVATLAAGLSCVQAIAATPYAGKTCIGPYESFNKTQRGAYVLEFNAAGTAGILWGNYGSIGDYAFKRLHDNPNIPRDDLNVEKLAGFSVMEQSGLFGSFAYNFVLDSPKRGTKLYLSALSPQGTAAGKDDVSGRYHGTLANDVHLLCHDRAK